MRAGLPGRLHPEEPGGRRKRRPVVDQVREADRQRPSLSVSRPIKKPASKNAGFLLVDRYYVHVAQNERNQWLAFGITTKAATSRKAAILLGFPPKQLSPRKTFFVLRGFCFERELLLPKTGI